MNRPLSNQIRSATEPAGKPKRPFRRTVRSRGRPTQRSSEGCSAARSRARRIAGRCLDFEVALGRACRDSRANGERSSEGVGGGWSGRAGPMPSNLYAARPAAARLRGGHGRTVLPVPAGASTDDQDMTDRFEVATGDLGGHALTPGARRTGAPAARGGARRTQMPCAPFGAPVGGAGTCPRTRHVVWGGQPRTPSRRSPDSCWSSSTPSVEKYANQNWTWQVTGVPSERTEFEAPGCRTDVVGAETVEVDLVCIHAGCDFRCPLGPVTPSECSDHGAGLRSAPKHPAGRASTPDHRPGPDAFGRSSAAPNNTLSSSR